MKAFLYRVCAIFFSHFVLYPDYRISFFIPLAFRFADYIIKENYLDVKLTKVDDIMEMMSYNILTTPAVVVDEVVKMKGQVPSENDVKILLGIS